MPAPITLIGNLDLSQPIAWGCPKIAEPPDGWDTMTEMLWLPDPGFLAKGTQRPTPAGLAGKFWVQDVRVMDWHAGRPLAEVVSHGLANNKPAKWSAQGIISEDTSLVWTASTIYRAQAPRVTKRWISEIQPALFEHVGVYYAPEETFGLPATSFNLSGAYPDWTAIGWLGESRNPDQLVGAKTCLVTDVWIYDVGYDRVDPENQPPAFSV